MNQSLLTTTGALVLGLFLSIPVLVTESAQAQETVDLTAWDREGLYQGLSIDNLLDTDVRGGAGEELGEVEDVLISPDGQVDSIIVEGGGFWDIGDTHFRVAWDKVNLGSDMEYVTIPMTEENVEEFSVFADWDDQETVRRWRATELLNDYVSLEDVSTYGVINDLIISKNGQVQAVIVTPDVSYGVTGPYPYPYYGYTPNAIYGLPYTRQDIADWEPFDYNKMGS